MTCLRGTEVIERKPNAGCTDMCKNYYPRLDKNVGF
jgi:hypothetical protein